MLGLHIVFPQFSILLLNILVLWQFHMKCEETQLLDACGMSMWLLPLKPIQNTHDWIEYYIKSILVQILEC